jgi:hypothetical protein
MVPCHTACHVGRQTAFPALATEPCRAVPCRAVPCRAVLFHAVLCLGVGVAFFTHSNMPKNVCEDSPPSCSVFFSLFNVE